MAEKGRLEVLITTYDMAWKPDDGKFLRKKISFDVSSPFFGQAVFKVRLTLI